MGREGGGEEGSVTPEPEGEVEEVEGDEEDGMGGGWLRYFTFMKYLRFTLTYSFFLCLPMDGWIDRS